ncbi:unnamed protein product [Rangifer tarandus platyrhynchus]|uniref:Uncharacterized protein n=2 Tax=Rangifer tarandus platyrhynchus TaxID=3082113 RepID=A0ACB0FKJ8_RANTA|nr:unnamed protein product [Rangifer tarandus platyrhynchus]CAI9713412.1 unnamed protein product [Rangifer tarandus platyrhynchus]
MPNERLVLRRAGSLGAYRWTYLVSELVSSSGCMFPFHEGKVYIIVSAKQWRNREDPRKRWFRQLPGTSPQAPQGQGASSSSSSQPSWGVVLAALLSETPQEPDIVRAQQPHAGSQKL